MTTPVDILHRIDALESEVRRLRIERAQTEQRPVLDPPTRDIFLAKTTTSGTYPSDPADTFEIVFLDGTYAKSAGSPSPTYTDHSAAPQTFAKSLAGNFYPENTPVPVFQQDGRFWIADSSSMETMGGTKLIEITDSDGTILSTDDYDLVDDTAVDCLYRGRIITHDPDSVDTCVRANVTDGADVWLKIRWSPWVAPRTQMKIGTTILARKINDSHVNGALDFPLYEGAWPESEVYGIEAVSGPDWSSTKLANLYDPRFTTLLESNVEIRDDSNNWDNVLVTGTSGRGLCIKVGDDLVPIFMPRRSSLIKFTLPSGGADAMSALDTSKGLNPISVSVSPPPFTGFSEPGTVFNDFRLALQDAGTGFMIWDEAAQRYVAVAVDRSGPMIVEISGSDVDGQGVESIQSPAGTALGLWDARLITPNQTSGNLIKEITAVNEQDVWLGFSGHANFAIPKLLPIGRKFLCYDSGRNFTPTGAAQRRLYLAESFETFWDRPFSNNTGEAVPPYALMVVLDADGRTNTDIPTAEISKPNGGDTTTQGHVIPASQLLINGPVTVPNGEFGFGASPVGKLVPVDIGSTSDGDPIGPDPAGASWQAELNQNGGLRRISNTLAPAGTAFVTGDSREPLRTDSVATMSNITTEEYTAGIKAVKFSSNLLASSHNGDVTSNTTTDKFEINRAGHYRLKAVLTVNLKDVGLTADWRVQANLEFGFNTPGTPLTWIHSMTGEAGGPAYSTLSIEHDEILASGDNVWLIVDVTAHTLEVHEVQMWVERISYRTS